MLDHSKLTATNITFLTVFFAAVEHGHVRIAESFFLQGLRLQDGKRDRHKPLTLAAKLGCLAMVERLLRRDNHSSLIFNLLMSHGGDIETPNSLGWQPLHTATVYGHLALVDSLLRQGASIEERLGSSLIKKDQTHKTVGEGYWAEARWPYPRSRALHLACEYGHEHIANLLISKGAKVEVWCGEGCNKGKSASTLAFCTTGPPIPKEDTERIQDLPKEAMNQVKKQKDFKVALEKASIVENKSNLLRAATIFITLVSRPPLHKAKTSAPVSDPASTRSDSMSSSLCPWLPRPSYTSPFPLQDSPSALTAQHPSVLDLPVSQAKVVMTLTVHSTTDSSRKSTDTAATGALSDVLVSHNAPNQAPRRLRRHQLAPEPETQLSTSPR
ncbi:MAG: hypothetical protein Q9208_000487 [Pyrenodesmia sp. 3 TL-2023]